MWKGIIRQYPEFYHFGNQDHVITMLEGNTPLIPAPRLAAKINPDISLFLKYEGLNPSCSFKDRGMTMAVSRAVESGAKSIICASTGNTSASAAAYGARAGLKTFVVIPEGKIALGKLAQAMIHGAIVIKVLGNFDQALKVVREICRELPSDSGQFHQSPSHRGAEISSLRNLRCPRRSSRVSCASCGKCRQHNRQLGWLQAL